MIENNRIRIRRFADAVRLYDSYLFIFSSKKPQLRPPNKKPALPPLSSRAPRSIVSVSKRRKLVKQVFG